MTSKLLTLRTFGDPILRQVAAPVRIFDSDLRVLLEQMHATMDAAGAQGVAGNQVGVLLRVFAWRQDSATEGNCINPQILQISAETQADEEGCASFPRAFRFLCERPTWADVRFSDLDGGMHETRVTNRLARTFLHEIDHLNDILFIDHLAMHDRQRADVLIAAGALDSIPQPYADGLQPRSG